MTATINLFLHRLDDGTDGPGPAAPASADEADRASRFHFEPDRRRWLAGRAWVRRTLGAALGLAPHALALSPGPHGKPRVVDAPPGFDCNWSHSGDWIALAISDSTPVGVDLELIRAGFPALEVAESFFTTAETAALARTRSPERERLFLRLWSAKEALMKATGDGVSLPPDRIDVRLAGSIPAGYHTHPKWQLARWDSHRWVSAVAWPADVQASVTLRMT
jgi:4'-phosphopantetheinyl transferase